MIDWCKYAYYAVVLGTFKIKLLLSLRAVAYINEIIVICACNKSLITACCSVKYVHVDSILVILVVDCGYVSKIFLVLKITREIF